MKKLLAKIFINKNKIIQLFKNAEDLYRIGKGANKKDFVLNNLFIPEWLKPEIYNLIQQIFEENHTLINYRTMKEPKIIGRFLNAKNH